MPPHACGGGSCGPGIWEKSPESLQRAQALHHKTIDTWIPPQEPCARTVKQVNVVHGPKSAVALPSSRHSPPTLRYSSVQGRHVCLGLIVIRLVGPHALGASRGRRSNPVDDKRVDKGAEERVLSKVHAGRQQ